MVKIMYNSSADGHIDCYCIKRLLVMQLSCPLLFFIYSMMGMLM